MTAVVSTWRPAEAARLQQALRLTNEAFADTLGAAPRTVAKWHANPSMTLTLEMQAALDTLLARASADAQQRFVQLAGLPAVSEPSADDVRQVAAQLGEARHLHSALTWLDDLQGAQAGASFAAVVAKAARATSRAGAADVSQRLDRQALAGQLLDYYSRGSGVPGNVHLTTAQGRLDTSLVVPERGAGVLGYGAVGGFELARAEQPRVPHASAELVRRAEERLVRALAGGIRFADQPTYRLLRCDTPPDGTRATFALTTFARYALTWDLLEEEVSGARRTGVEPLALRDELLPNMESVLTPAVRECVGGTLALTACARPARGDRPADYLLLVQERSGRVVNGAGRMAVIPKCFHQPTNEPRAEVDIRTTLLRELEEELFGRAEVDSTGEASRFADVLHPSRMTRPLRWLMGSTGLDIRLTGFAYNLVAGSYEFPALVAVHDEAFWSQFGGDVEANWESTGLTRYSSVDPDGIEELLNDPRWSNEGLVAFALGLKQLAETNPERVRLPDFEIGVTH